MRFAILSRKGIEKIIDETLQDLPVNQRFSRVNGQVYETVPYKVQVIPAHSSYSQDMNGTSRIIDLMGPYKDVPNFAVASNEKERKRILKTSDGEVFGIKQNQLIVLDKGIFFRHLDLNGYSHKIRAQNVEGIHFSNGYCVSQNKQRRQLQGTEVGFGGEIANPYETYRYGIGSPRIWGHLVEHMTDYFLTHNLWTAESNKVLFGSERSRDKVVETFKKFGLKPVQ